MSKVVYFKPLDELGEVPLNLDECRRFVCRMDRDRDFEDDSPEPGEVLSITFYLTPDGRWVEHRVEVEFPPWETLRGYEDIFEEVSPAYIIQELSLHKRKLPRELAILEPYREAMRQDALRPDAPWLYGPRSLLEPAPVQARGVEPIDAPAALVTQQGSESEPPEAPAEPPRTQGSKSPAPPSDLVPVSPLSETIGKLKGSPRKAELVRYLWDRSEREAELKLVAIDIYKARESSLHNRMKTVRRQVERTRVYLEGNGCPLRLVVSANSVLLVVTKMSS